MSRELTRILADCQNSNCVIKNYDEQASVGLMIFGYLEDSEESFGSSSISGDSDSYGQLDDEQEDDVNSFINAEENKAFWESQDQLLEATLCRSSSIESTIRQATKKAMRELDLMGSSTCVCRKPPVTETCPKCLKREVSLRLQNWGFNCAICKSKWMSSKEVISGEHTYLEVIDSSKKGEIRVIIELNFRAEFEMAKAGEEYNQLTNRLPEVFVGKIERLRALIKILCSASKKCMKEKKMHMAPWRKHKYMQAKWGGTRELNAATAVLPSPHFDQRPPRQRASMLSFDLLETLPGLHCPAIRVVS